jgi:hypothetical protein
MGADPNGLPVLDGIWHRNLLLLRCTVTDNGMQRSLQLNAEIRDFLPPRRDGRYQTLIQDEQPCPAIGGSVLCGTLRTDLSELGFVLGTAEKGILFVASFHAARPFIRIKVRLSHIFAENASGEIWRFDVSDPERITAEILPKGYVI